MSQTDHTNDSHSAEMDPAKGATEYSTIAPTTSASADTDITKPAVFDSYDVRGATWYQRACAEASHDKAAASSAKADVNRIGGVAVMRTILTKATRMWDNGSTLTYTFLGPKAGNTIQRNKVKKVVQEWERYANVNFTFVPTGNATVRITFDPNLGSWSYVGNEISLVNVNNPTMNLGWIGGHSTTITAEERGVILHEFGHTLGLMHEHQSPIHGGTITLKESAVIDFYKKTHGWEEREVREQILSVYNVSGVGNFSAPDVKSIMASFMPADMNKQNREIKPNNVLSETDKAFMTINYPHPTNHPIANSIWTMNHALDVAGVDPETKSKIIESYELSEWAEVRYLFSGFCTTACRAGSIKRLQVVERSNGVVDGPSVSKVHASTTGAVDFPTASALVPSAVSQVISSPNGFFDVPSAASNVIPGTSSVFDDPSAVSNVIPSTNGFFDVPSAVSNVTNGFFDVASTVANVIPSTNGFFVVPSAVSNVIPSTNGVFDVPSAASSVFSGMKGVFDVPSAVSQVIASTNGVVDVPSAVSDVIARTNGFFDVPSAASQAIESANGVVDVPSAVSNVIASTNGFFDVASAVSNIIPSTNGVFDVPSAVSNVFVSTNGVVDVPSASVVSSNRHYSHPAHGLDVPTAAKAAFTASSVSQGKFLEVIVNSLKQVFPPTTGQCFAFQFPARFLQKDLYAWDTSAAGIYGQFVKPVAVNESEFRLVDQLYNVGEVVGAPNGQNLSVCYEQVLNNLVPGHENDYRIIARQQAQIRRWLMKEVPATGWVKNLIESQQNRSVPLSAAVGSTVTSPYGEPVPQFAVANRLSEDGKVNRMELAEALMEEYLSAKQVWELERDTMIKNARAKDENVDDITRKLAHITAVREAQLAAKHADAVVRGYSRTIRQYLGYMDIKSPSEMLQDAKDALREAVTSSLDGAMNIYPVQLSPIDWFQGLSSSFTIEDLTSDPKIILQQINAKSKLLDLLQSRLAALQFSPKNDLKALKLAAEQAQSEYSKCQSNLQTTYSSNVLSLAQSFVSAANEFQSSLFVTQAKLFGIAESAFNGIEDSMKKATAAHDAVNSASRAYSQALSAVTLAEATDTSQEITSITLQIDAVRKEITELTTRVQVLSASPATPEYTRILADFPFFPPHPSGTAGGSRWQEITLTHETSVIHQASTTQVSSSVSGSDVSFFWGSKGQTSTSFAEDLASSSSESFKVDIGFRATMVTVDRGGWFQPQFFKQTSGFCHIDKKIFASKWPEGINSMEDLENATPAQWEELNKGLFPAYPVGFIICKDITIKVNMSTEQLRKYSKEFEESVQSASGIFCWSNSGISHSKVSERGADILSASDGVVIRIPGPQILGYMLQYVDNDLSQDLKANLPDNFLISDEDYEAGFDKIDNSPTVLGAAHALASPVANLYTDIPAAATAISPLKDVSPPEEVSPLKEFYLLEEVSLPKEVLPLEEVSLKEVFPPKDVSPLEQEPVYSSGYYFAPKLRV